MKLIIAFALFVALASGSAFTAANCTALCTNYGVSCGFQQGGFPDATTCGAWCAAAAGAGFGGDTTDSAVNTLGCRYKYSVLAAADNATNCPKASIVSTTATCGPIDATTFTHAPCVHYCLLSSFNGCNETYSVAPGAMNNTQCFLACAGGPSGSAFVGGWPTNGAMFPAWTTTTDTLQCRIYHAAAAIEAPTVHCPHAAPHGGTVCGTLAQGAAYVCANLAYFCTPLSLFPYSSLADCVGNFSTVYSTAGASAFWGAHGFGSANDYKCRYYHGGLPTQVAPAVHCAHAGPISAVCTSAPSAAPTAAETGSTVVVSVLSVIALIACFLF